MPMCSSSSFVFGLSKEPPLAARYQPGKSKGNKILHARDILARFSPLVILCSRPLIQPSRNSDVKYRIPQIRMHGHILHSRPP